MKTLLSLLLLTICLSSKAQIDFIYQANGNVVSFSLTQSSQFYEGVKWDFGDGNSVYGQTSTHTYTTTGNYTVCVIGFPMPIAQSDTVCKSVNILITGIQKNKLLNDIKIFPNPTKDFVNLNLSNDAKDTRILLINSLGKVVLTQDVQDATSNIDLRNLPAGLYLLKVQNTTETRVIKIIKE